jgi:uncharacterized protein YjbK
MNSVLNLDQFHKKLINFGSHNRDRNRIEYANNSIRFDSSQPIRIDFELNFFVSESNRTELNFLLTNRIESNKDFSKIGRIESNRISI